jgi:hypothetical protein
LKGEIPNTTATGTGNFTIGSVSWNPGHNPFEGSTEYTATVSLTAEANYTFTGLSSATINGNPASITNNTGNAVTLFYTFTETSEKTVSGITIISSPSNPLTYTHGDTLNLSGLVVRITYTDTTTEDIVLADFAGKSISANPAHNQQLVRSAHNSQPVVVSLGSHTANTGNLSVNQRSISISGFNITRAFNGANTVSSFGSLSFNGLASGESATVNTSGVTATYGGTLVGPHNITFSGSFGMIGGNAVPSNYNITQPTGITGAITAVTPSAPIAPGLGAVTQTSVTLTAPTVGHFLHSHFTMEYARSVPGGTTVDNSTWQNGLTFNGLNRGATYRFFARYRADVQRNNVSAASTGLQVTTSTHTNLIVPGSSLADKLAWLGINVLNGGSYIIEVSAHENINPAFLNYDGNISITLRSTGAERIIGLISNGSLFSVHSGVTLILDNNITLQGQSGNSYPLVFIYANGNLVMNTETKIIDNPSSSGVRVDWRGNFTMNGGKISGHNFSGVNVDGNFTMNGGEISGNSTASNGGGGVRVNGGNFTMNGGKISENTSIGNPNFSSFFGGGVHVNGGNFTMNGGEISGNTSDGSNYFFAPQLMNLLSGGGGVAVRSGTFIMKNGKIAGNIVTYNTSFNIYGGGGGVLVGAQGVNGSTFIMEGGEISGNTAWSGGGVLVFGSTSLFTKSGGTIYGFTLGNNNSNIATADNNTGGHAVSSDTSRRDTTAGPGVNMDSRIGGAAGGWEN